MPYHAPKVQVLMSIDYQDALKRSRDRRPFANGTEGYGWMANWCDRCLRDAPFRNMGKGSGCPLLMVAMVESRTPAEWLEQVNDEGLYSIGDHYHCIEFRAPGGDGGNEPKPKPDPRGQGTLFDRPPSQSRMLTREPEREQVMA